LKVAQKIVYEMQLDQVKLTDRPKQMSVPIVQYDPMDDGLIYRKSKLNWALRNSRYETGLVTVLFFISMNHVDLAWRVQEVV
jgi:hypothetical protein